MSRNVGWPQYIGPRIGSQEKNETQLVRKRVVLVRQRNVRRDSIDLPGKTTGLQMATKIGSLANWPGVRHALVDLGEAPRLSCSEHSSERGLDDLI